MRSAALAASKDLYVGPYTAGSQQGKQHQFEAFFLTLKDLRTDTPMVVAKDAVRFHVVPS